MDSNSDITSALEIAKSGANQVSDGKVVFCRNPGCALADFYGHYGPSHEGPAMKSGLSTFSFYFIDLYKNAFYLESAMEAPVGRDVEILRSVFSADIARGTSL